MKRLLLCTDLDRTLLPNGGHAESPAARRLFGRLARRDDVALVYAPGRDLGLTLQAMHEFDLPCPEAIVSDVGTTISLPQGGAWQPWHEWERHISPGWRHLPAAEVYSLVRGLPGIVPQEDEKQGRHKLSFYVDAARGRDRLEDELSQRLHGLGLSCRLVWSFDEMAGRGLLDIIPAGAGKLPALHFVIDGLGYGRDEAFFAGDSGNDREVLCSDIAAVLVANAHHTLRRELATALPPALHLARGGYLGMNGNYSAGILEGVAHFRPHLDHWLRQLADNLEGA